MNRIDLIALNNLAKARNVNFDEISCRHNIRDFLKILKICNSIIKKKSYNFVIKSGRLVVFEEGLAQFSF